MKRAIPLPCLYSTASTVLNVWTNLSASDVPALPEKSPSISAYANAPSLTCWSVCAARAPTSVGAPGVAATTTFGLAASALAGSPPRIFRPLPQGKRIKIEYALREVKNWWKISILVVYTTSERPHIFCEGPDVPDLKTWNV